MAYEQIADHLGALRRAIPEGVELVAVSNFHPVEALRRAYDAGQRVFGESRVPEMSDKAAAMPADVEWHFIGHLQTNKVRALLPHVTLIHSVDSERLLRLIDAESRRIGRRTQVLIQLHVAREETKFGFTPDEAIALLSSELVAQLPGVEVRGVMGMASNVDDAARIRADFRAIRDVFDRLRAGVFAGNPRFGLVSMGMSHDWPIAVEEGANMVRVGTDIFGEREY